MLQMMMGGRVYETAKFKQAMDSRYYPLDSMKQSVATLKNSQNIDIETMEFGQYQPILAPSEINRERTQSMAEERGICSSSADRSTQYHAAVQGPA